MTRENAKITNKLLMDITYGQNTPITILNKLNEVVTDINEDLLVFVRDFDKNEIGYGVLIETMRAKNIPFHVLFLKAERTPDYTLDEVIEIITALDKKLYQHSSIYSKLFIDLLVKNKLTVSKRTYENLSDSIKMLLDRGLLAENKQELLVG